MSIGELRQVIRDAGILRNAQDEPTPSELADILWLTSLLKPLNPTTSAPLAEEEPPPQGSGAPSAIAPETRTETDQTSSRADVPQQGAAMRQPPSISPDTPLDLKLPHSEPEGTGAARTIVTVTMSPQLPEPLPLARAMRPLRQRMVTSAPGTLDEEATADLRAEQRLWLPALRPATEPTHDLAIVIDDSESMALWSTKTREVRLLCEQLGGLRDVRTWHLATELSPYPGQPVLQAAAPGSPARDARELADPSGRRIILVVTDGVHPWWAPSGPLRPVLARWAMAGPVAIIQPFPQRLWSRSRLRPVAGRFWSGWPGRGPTIADANSVTVPVLELTPQAVGRWASLMSGGSGAVSLAAATLPTEASGDGFSMARAEPADPDPERLVRAFRASVSPTAYRLAGYLSAAQLTLPIMRLVQESMMDGTGPAELAEVLLSGLLRRSSSTRPMADPDSVEYVFRAGVREVLQSTLTRDEALSVLEQVGSYLLRARSGGRSFPAALTIATEECEDTDESAAGHAAREFPESFGRISAMLLDRLRDAVPSAPSAPSAPSVSPAIPSTREDHDGKYLSPFAHIRRRNLWRQAIADRSGNPRSSAAGRILERAYAADPAGTGSLGDIEHVVLLMQSNRSFDHYFGTMSGVRGFDEASPAFEQRGYEPGQGLSPDGYLNPFRLDSGQGATLHGEMINDPSHHWGPQHRVWNNGAMDRWVVEHLKTEGLANGPAIMGYYTREDIPVHRALADAFTICDHYFCSVLGPASPNRLYWMTGTIDPEGQAGGPLVETPLNPMNRIYSWRTYPEQLEEAGVSWKIYQHQGVTSFLERPFLSGMMGQFKAFSENPDSRMAERALKQSFPNDFRADVRNGTLPEVSWIIPSLLTCEHPAMPTAEGAAGILRVLDTLLDNREVWEKTALIVSYDENGGFFDHVAPPTPPPGTPGEYLTAPLGGVSESAGIDGPIGLGFRVPCLIISPYSRGGLVASDVFDHTSQLRFLERRFGVEVPNLTAWRKETVGDMTSAFDFARPVSVPLPPPPDPGGSGALRALVGDNISRLLAVFDRSKPYEIPANRMPRQEPLPIRGRPSGLPKA